MMGERQQLRITVHLDPSKPAQNIFNYQELINNKPQQIHPKRRIDKDDVYDEEDDFIDDSELFQEDGEGEDLPWEFGYFAWRGSLDSLFKNKEKAVVGDDKPRVSVERIASSEPLKVIDLYDEATEEMEAPLAKETKRKVSKSKKKVPDAEVAKQKKSKKMEELSNKTATTLAEIIPDEEDLPPLPKEVQVELDCLKELAQQADFTVKKVFPPSLKPQFIKTVNIAMDYAVMSSPFWKQITTILPYNKFTMKKLATKIVFPDRIDLLKGQLVMAYKDFATKVNDSTEEGQKKMRWTDPLRICFWNILCMEWEIATMDNMKKEAMKETPEYNELTVRKAAYQKMQTLVPNQFDGNMLSQQYSNFKKKREQMFQDKPQYPEQWQEGIIRADPFAKSQRRTRKSETEPSSQSTPQPKKRKSMSEVDNIVDKKQRI